MKRTFWLFWIFYSLLKSIRASLFVPEKAINIKGTANGVGYSVSSAGDINKDGYEDIIIGAQNTNNNQGAVYIIYGGKTSYLKDINSLAASSLDPVRTGFTVTGSAAGDYFGVSVSSAGDINKDGYDDIIIGANGANSGKGAAYVIYGGKSSSLKNIDLSIPGSLDPTKNGFMAQWNTAITGISVSGAGDVNKDGYDDIIIGAFHKDINSGAAYIIYGSKTPSHIDLSSDLAAAKTGFTLTRTSKERFGLSVSSAGDINKDGYDDIIIGAPGFTNFRGSAYVIYGGSSLPNMNFAGVGATILDPASTGFLLKGPDKGDLGWSVSSAGDINKDGYDDIVVGASRVNDYQGVVYVIYGGEKTSLRNYDFFSESLSPATGFTIKGNASQDYFGRSVRNAGDVNNDGYDDLILGAYKKDSNKGAAYVVYGGSNLKDIDLSAVGLDPTKTGFLIPANITGSQFGSSVSAGDINGDGFSDILIGAPSLDGVLGTTSIIIYNQCTENCKTCKFQSICLECIDGYTLLESESNPTQLMCENQKDLGNKNQASSAAFEGTSAMGSSLTSGSSLPLNFGLVAKSLRNLKYLNISVSVELRRTFFSWKASSGLLSAPESWNMKSESYTLPEVFSRYGLQPIFLVNYWKIFMMTLIGLAVFALFKWIEKMTSNKFMRAIHVAASNFALTQFYSNLDDIIFYFILDMRSLIKFDSAFRVVSCILAVILLITGVIFMVIHFMFLLKYQGIKKKNNSADSYKEKYENIKLIFQDYKDTNFAAQSFLLINIIRSLMSSLIIGLFFEYPLFQTLLLSIVNLAMIGFLLMKRSFKELVGNAGQFFCEFVLLIANISMFVMAIFDQVESQPYQTIERFSKLIIILNWALMIGCVVIIFASMGVIIFRAYQEKQKKSLAAGGFTVNNRLNAVNLDKSHISFDQSFQSGLVPQNKGFIAHEKYGSQAERGHVKNNQNMLPKDSYDYNTQNNLNLNLQNQQRARSYLKPQVHMIEPSFHKNQASDSFMDTSNGNFLLNSSFNNMTPETVFKYPKKEKIISSPASTKLSTTSPVDFPRQESRSKMPQEKSKRVVNMRVSHGSSYSQSQRGDISIEGVQENTKRMMANKHEEMILEKTRERIKYLRARRLSSQK